MNMTNEEKAQVESLGDFVEAARKYADSAEQYMMNAEFYFKQAQEYYKKILDSNAHTVKMIHDIESFANEIRECRKEHECYKNKG